MQVVSHPTLVLYLTPSITPIARRPCRPLHVPLSPGSAGVCFCPGYWLLGALWGGMIQFDFGLARVVKRRNRVNARYEMTGETGSMRYMAPEVRVGSVPILMMVYFPVVIVVIIVFVVVLVVVDVFLLFPSLFMLVPCRRSSRSGVIPIASRS